jgi:RNA polymerase sigma factor (sigma-70 family)
VTSKELNELFENAQTGNIAAEKQLFLHLTERFRYLAALRIWDSMDGEEIVQSAMLIIFREYRTLAVTTSFAAWAQKVFENRLYTFQRSQRGSEKRLERNPLVYESAEARSEDFDLRIRLIECMKQICHINRPFARVLNWQSQGYEADEICQRMKLKKNTFYSLLRRSRAMLLKCIESGKVQ